MQRDPKYRHYCEYPTEIFLGCNYECAVREINVTIVIDMEIETMPFARGMLGMPCFIFVFFCGVLIYPETHLHFIPSVSFFHCAPSLWYHLHSRAPSPHTYICTYARSFSGHTSSFGYFGVFSLKHRAHFKKKQCHSEIKTKPSSKNREFSKSRLLLIPWNIKI